MKSKTTTMIGLVGAGCVLLSAGCRSARYEKEAEGLQYHEGAAAVAVEGIPGGAMIDTIAIQAKVLDIDYRKREVKLLIPGGQVVKTKVGPDAVNFDQVKKGDIVNAVITEEIVFQLVSAGTKIEDGAVVAAAIADKGQMPAGVAEAAVRITATIVKIDAKARTIKLKLEDGETKTLTVRDDVEMNTAKVGDKVVIDMFEAVAVSVDHVAKTK
jgi:hypothetical protein